MSNVWGTLAFMLGLIALYLIVVNAGGSATVLGALNNTLTGETRALQGR